MTFFNTLHDSSSGLTESTTVVAVAATVSPFWLPWLSMASETSALILPILGVLWLIIRMWATIKDINMKQKEKNTDKQ